MLISHTVPSLVPLQRKTFAFERRSSLPLEHDCLWYIVHGLVRASTWHENGDLIVLGLWGAADVVGLPLSQAEPLSLECLTAVGAMRVPREQWPHLTEAIVRHAQLGSDLLTIVQCKDVLVAIESAIGWLARRFGREVEEGCLIDLRLTHQDLAELVGTSRVTVTRALNHLERLGAVRRLERHRTLVCSLPAAARL